jgi:hypothetical protein
MKQSIFYFIVIIGLVIAGILGHLGGEVPDRLAFPSLIASGILLTFLGWFLKRQGMLR